MLTIFLIISIAFNIHGLININPKNTTNATTAPSSTQSQQKSFDDLKASTPLKLRKNGTTIECQRTFYLFHQDQVN